ncbi:uncharacterized protein B0J16DRAFT_383828 [Fusarium flagelliforme]|uniref:uncharacterized protein n=1 Tax=Fusarium flagelliforme TaxID=2675880 RepID=UPI001E8DCC2E|nr:uncharacterized protein B0J16DRAFT_383828 [Fusarium flagelliforme]KAH7184774.1 hypothetical protein B0J16DRAFT_383828 [Fusarium flagelliforme]
MDNNNNNIYNGELVEQAFEIITTVGRADGVYTDEQWELVINAGEMISDHMGGAHGLTMVEYKILEMFAMGIELPNQLPWLERQSDAIRQRADRPLTQGEEHFFQLVDDIVATYDDIIHGEVMMARQRQAEQANAPEPPMVDAIPPGENIDALVDPMAEAMAIRLHAAANAPPVIHTSAPMPIQLLNAPLVAPPPILMPDWIASAAVTNAQMPTSYLTTIAADGTVLEQRVFLPTVAPNNTPENPVNQFDAINIDQIPQQDVLGAMNLDPAAMNLQQAAINQRALNQQAMNQALISQQAANQQVIDLQTMQRVVNNQQAIQQEMDLDIQYHIANAMFDNDMNPNAQYHNGDNNGNGNGNVADVFITPRYIKEVAVQS